MTPSEENAYGVVDLNWIHGEETKLTLDNVINDFKIKSTNYKQLSLTSNCTNDYFDNCVIGNVFYTLWTKKFTKVNFSPI